MKPITGQLNIVLDDAPSMQVSRDEVVALAERVGFTPQKLPPNLRDEWIGRMMLFAHFLLESRRD